MALNFYPTTKSYSYTPKDNPKDRVRVVVGDDKDVTTFHPQVKLERFDNEINASIRLKHNFITGKVSYSDDGTKITWKKGQWKAVFYDRPDASNEGGFEFEIHIPKKPPINYLDFSVNTKQLDWFYQPALTPEEITEGAQRPDNVVGSYAVYYKDCPANYVGGKEYKVGKAFHLFRPHITDSAGHETWGEWTLDEANGILRLTCPQSFLDTAVYPVVVDPTFGYTTAGGSNSQYNGSDIFGYYALGASGTVDSISFYSHVASGTIYFKGVLVLASNKNIVSNGIGNQSSAIPVTYANRDWVVSSYTTKPSISAVYYYPSAIFTGSFYMYYDDGGATDYWFYDMSNDYTSVSNPTDGNTLQNYIMSVYATYTASGGGTKMQLNIGDTFKTVSAVKINIGDVWKDVTHASVNVGDTWRTIF